MQFNEKIIAIKCQTNGINWGASDLSSEKDVSHKHQALSWGLVLSDTETFKPQKDLYIEVKWDGISKWDERTEKIHGFSKEYLEEKGVSEEDALAEIIEFIMENIGTDKPIYLLGRNPTLFELPFLQAMFRKYEVSGIKFAQRHLDIFSLTMGTIQEGSTNNLYKKLGIKTPKKSHSLVESRNCLEAFRKVNTIWRKLTTK